MVITTQSSVVKINSKGTASKKISGYPEIRESKYTANLTMVKL